MTKEKEEGMKKSTLDEIMSASLEEKTELGEVAKEFNTSTPSSSNLTNDEFRLVWRSKNILRKMSPNSVNIINEFVDMKRSVNGWNTNKKVEALTGIQQQRSGSGFVEKLFKPKA